MLTLLLPPIAGAIVAIICATWLRDHYQARLDFILESKVCWQDKANRLEKDLQKVTEERDMWHKTAIAYHDRLPDAEESYRVYNFSRN